MSEKLTLPAPSDPDPIFVELESGREVVITDVGSGKHGVLIALHGTPGSHFDFRYLGGELERSGCRVIRINLPGHGKTALSAMGELGDAAAGKPLARLVLEICDKMKLDRPFVLAHSLGSQVAMNVGMQAPEKISGIMLLNPVPCVGRPHRMIRPYWFVRFGAVLNDTFDQGSFRRVWRTALRLLWIAWGFTPRITGAEAAHGQRRLKDVDFWNQAERSAALKKAKVPTLMCWAKDDPMIEAELFHELSQSLPGGPRLVFPTGGHFINKHHAQPIAAAILDFIAMSDMKHQASAADPRP